MIVDEAMNEKEPHKGLPLKHPSLNPHSLEHKGPDFRIWVYLRQFLALGLNSSPSLNLGTP